MARQNITTQYLDLTEISNSFRKKLTSQDFAPIFFTIILHAVLLFALVFQYQKNFSNKSLSFSFLVADVSSSSSSQVSSVSSNKSKAQKSQIFDEGAKIAAKEEDKISKQSFDSIDKTAVLTPDVEASFDAASLNNQAPKYPEISRRLGEEGLVMLRVLVDENGAAKKVELKKTSGFERLDKSAFETVSSWKFIAAKKSGTSVLAWVQIPIRFSLQ